MNRLNAWLSLIVISFCLQPAAVFSQATYCTPVGACPTNDRVYIASVKFNTLSNTTACGGYTLFPESGTTTTTVERGTSYLMTVGFYGYYFNSIFGVYTYYNQHALAFIDFNGDGDFDDANEFIAVGTGDDSRPAKGMIPIPADAKLGKIRVRLRQGIAVQGSDALAACNNMANGLYKVYDTEDYTITVIEKNSTVPSCPQTYSPTNNAVNVPRNAGLTFTWSGATGGTNTTYDFYLGTSPTTLTAVATNLVSADGFTGTYSHPYFLEPNTSYYYKVVSKNDRGVNAACSIQKFTTAAATNDYYCTPSGNCDLFYNTYIKSVTLNTLSNTTTCSGLSAYMHYPASGATTTSLTKGNAYTLRVATSRACNMGYLGAWIDLNQNGSFDDAGEFFDIPDSSPTGTCEPPFMTVTIPSTAVSGKTRIRVRLASDGSGITADQSCLDFNIGETEDYTITILPAAGCNTLTASYIKTDNQTSSSEASGSITVTPSGGTAPYAITWTGGAISGFNPTGLLAGVYYAVLTDAAGCSYAMPPISISAPPVFKVEQIVAVNPSCQENGSIRVDVSGGVGPYTYDWGPLQSAGNFINNLGAGTYTVVIKDSKGLTLTPAPVVLRTLSVSYSTVPATCAIGGFQETVHVSATGGIPPYQYAWRKILPLEEPLSFNAPDIPVPPGTYAVTVTDAAGCTFTIPEIVVDGPPPIILTASVTPLNCNGSGNTTGEIWLTASNGTAPYRYEVYDNVTGSPSFGATPIEDQKGFRLVDVPASSVGYTLVAFDANGCQSEFGWVSVGELASLNPNSNFSFGCSGKTADLTYAEYQPGMNFIWFEDAEGTIPLDTAAVFTTPVLTQPQSIITYYLANYQNGCYTNIIPLTVSIVPTPLKPVIASGGSTTLCNGGTVSLSAPPDFAQYHWSTGAETQSVSTSQPGQFSVYVEDDYGCVSPASDIVEVKQGSPAAQPVINVTGGTTFCAGGSVLLSAPVGYSHYKWSDGSTTRAITVTTTGEYTVQATAPETCESTPSAAVAVLVNPLPAVPAITAGGALSFCEGGTVMLSAPPGFGGYRWSDGETTQTITIAQSGAYSVQVDNGCESLPSAASNVTVSPLPASPETIIQPGPATLKAIGTTSTYQWILEEQVLSVTTAEITVSESGQYHARSRSEAGCLSPESVSYVFVVTGTETPAAGGMSVYPNPSTGIVHIGISREAEVQVVNTAGQQLSVQRLLPDAVLDLTALPPGLYNLIIRQGQETVIKPLVRK